MKTLFTLLPVLLLAFPVFASETWDDVPGTVNADGSSCNYVKKPSPAVGQPRTRWCFFDAAQATSETTVTTILPTWMCENVDVFCVSEIGDDATFNNTCTAYNLLGTAINANDFAAILIRNATLDGDPSTADDTSALYGVSAYNFYVRFSTTESATTSRVAVACHPRP